MLTLIVGEDTVKWEHIKYFYVYEFVQLFKIEKSRNNTYFYTFNKANDHAFCTGISFKNLS